MVVNTIEAIILYFNFVVMDGDYLNDWLTHMPPTLRAIMEHIGKIIDKILDP